MTDFRIVRHKTLPKKNQRLHPKAKAIMDVINANHGFVIELIFSDRTEMLNHLSIIRYRNRSGDIMIEQIRTTNQSIFLKIPPKETDSE